MFLICPSSYVDGKPNMPLDDTDANDRPIVLAGFSQGADMCYRLLEEYFGNEELYSRLIAVYAIG